VKNPFDMDFITFQKAVNCLQGFPKKSKPDRNGRKKVVGIMGGEPLLHSLFPEFVDYISRMIPVAHRGLWTGLDYKKSVYRKNVETLLGDFTPNTFSNSFGYLNCNFHHPPSRHQPVLIAIKDVVFDEAEMWKAINNCWLQQQWSSAINPKGFFFCEVAAAFDWVFNGPGGLPIEPDCWQAPLEAFRYQIEKWCPMCGIPIPWEYRLDNEEIDDVTYSNLEALIEVDAPSIKEGRCILHSPPFDSKIKTKDWEPSRYL